MENKEKGKTWRGISEEIIVGMTEWRQQNPKATFRMIEEELDRRLAELRVTDVGGSGGKQCQCELGERDGWAGVPELWSGTATKREKGAETSNPRRARGGVRARIWCLSKMWTRDFSPWMKNWNCCQGS